ncbi:MAG: MBOAT family protein [Oscillospiraceae bacterium]|nr:MBOAT family protein [Oscillospiraceae bacterium]
MLFNSIEFILFFPTVVIIYFLLPFKLKIRTKELEVRNWFLLLASCYFYMSFIPVYIFILIIDGFVDYTGTFFIEKYRDNPKLKKLFFILPLVIDLSVLVYFKYAYFTTGIINFFGLKMGMNAIVLPDIILPIGISFHTFQGIGYLIDVYKGKVKVERNPVTYTLFLMFFPQLVAGPIERTANLMNQFKEKHYLTYLNISQGGRMMLWGMVKKILIADNLAIFVDAVYKSPQDFGGAAIYIALIFFAFQIYCDFSGYSDIAIGAAQIMGFKLMKNFDMPYFADSITNFWRKWHISLSTWFRDYIYIPLGGNRVSRPRWCLNQIITFSISGLWHGASFTFIIWGFLHGILIIIDKLMENIKKKISDFINLGKLNFIKTFLSVCLTFCITCITWILFRADSFGDALYILKNVFSGLPKFESINKTAELFSGIPRQNLYVSIFCIILLLAMDFICRKSDFRTVIGKVPVFVRLPVYALLVCLILVFGAYENKSFIYFQF